MSDPKAELQPKNDSEETTNGGQPSVMREESADALGLGYTVSGPRTHHSDAERHRIMESLLVEQAELWERLADS